MALDLLDAKHVTVVRRALAVNSVISAQGSVRVSQEHSASVAIAARQDTGAFPAAGHVSVTDIQRNATKELVSVSIVGATQLGTSVKSVLMDTMETQCWVQEADVSHALVQMDLRVDVTLLPPVTKTTIADRWSATVNRATQVRAVRIVPLVTMVIPLSPVAAASHVAVVTTSTYQILSHVTGGLGSVSNVSTTLRDLSVRCVRAATMAMLLVATAGSALATSWAQSAVSVFPEMTVCASVPQDSASVCLMSLDSPVITVHQTTGTWLVATDVNPAIVTPTMPTHQPATSSQATVSVVMALVERLAGTARRTSGVILESSAELVTVTLGALRLRSVTV